MKLQGKAALVTGASRGLGRAIAVGLAREGARVGVHYRGSAQEAEAAVREIEALGGEAVALEADVRDKAQVEAMFQQFLERFGQLDILVNNAGIMYNTPFVDMPEEEWDAVMETNVKGYFLCGQQAARHMIPRRAGKIINVSSTRQEQAWPGNAHYCASKGAIYMLTRVMALELGPHGIRVNSISPGTIETDLNRHTLSDPEFRRNRIARIPVGRLGVPEDVVGAAVFLASDESDFVNGAFLMIDGGQTIW